MAEIRCTPAFEPMLQEMKRRSTEPYFDNLRKKALIITNMPGRIDFYPGSVIANQTRRRTESQTG
jgi:hypothetical protein